MAKSKLSTKLIIGTVLLYLFFNIVFNFNIWRDIVKPSQSMILTTQGESPIYEYAAEIIRLNILSGKNPFTQTDKIMYPFGWNFVMGDMAPINGFYFVLLRLFLSPHQSLMLIVVLGILASNMLMFFLLRKFRIRNALALLFGLVYGFTPFISYRVGGHPTYTALYLFPLFGLAIYDFLKKPNKTIHQILLSFAIVLAVLTNLYYLVMIVLTVFVLIFIYLIHIKFQIQDDFRKYCIPLFKSFIVTIVLLLPFLIKAIEYLSVHSYSRPLRLIDYEAFSADVSNILIPSRWNPFYVFLIAKINQWLPHSRYIFEDFIYPGLLILIPYTFSLKYYKKLSGILKLLFWTSLFFLILSFGPYLKFFDISTKIPLPYILFQKIPFVQLARAPARFVIVFIFFASILSAYMVEMFMKKNIHHKLNKSMFIVILFIIFIIDQSYYTARGLDIKFPIRIYTYAKQNHIGPILNIPFTIRDGITSIGYFNGIWLSYTELLHHQPIYSVYAGRLNQDIFYYYSNNYLFGTLDKVLNHNISTQKTLEIDNSKLIYNLDFFNVYNIILKTNESYSEAVENKLIEVGFRPIIREDSYILLKRNYDNGPEVLKADFISPQHNLTLFTGFYPQEGKGGFRWTHGKISQVLFRTNKKRPFYLLIKAEAIVQPQHMKVFIRDKYIGEIIIPNDKVSTFRIDLGNTIYSGINVVRLEFSHSYLLGKLVHNAADLREVSLNIKQLELQDK